MPNNKEMEKQLSSQLSRILRERFGRGPRSTYFLFKPPFITIYLQDFSTPMEDILLERGKTKEIENLREEVMTKVLKEIEQIVEEETKYQCKEIYYDWNLHVEQTCTGMIWGILNVPKEEQERFKWPGELNERMFRERFIKLSEKAQKKPEELHLHWVGQKELMVERIGCLVEVEKALIEHGYEEDLRVVKKPLEKKMFTRDMLGSLLQEKIEEVFVNWNFQEDKGYTIILLQRNT